MTAPTEVHPLIAAQTRRDALRAELEAAQRDATQAAQDATAAESRVRSAADAEAAVAARHEANDAGAKVELLKDALTQAEQWVARLEAQDNAAAAASMERERELLAQGLLEAARLLVEIEDEAAVTERRYRNLAHRGGQQPKRRRALPLPVVQGLRDWLKRVER